MLIRSLKSLLAGLGSVYLIVMAALFAFRLYQSMNGLVTGGEAHEPVLAFNIPLFLLGARSLWHAAVSIALKPAD